MYFHPHILQKKIAHEQKFDMYGRPLPNDDSGEEQWEDLCQCRCDDNVTKEFKSENGMTYRPNFHVVYESGVYVSAGDKIRCIGDNGEIRGEGIVYAKKDCNYLEYSELWM